MLASHLVNEKQESITVSRFGRKSARLIVVSKRGKELRIDELTNFTRSKIPGTHLEINHKSESQMSKTRLDCEFF